MPRGLARLRDTPRGDSQSLSSPSHPMLEAPQIHDCWADSCFGQSVPAAHLGAPELPAQVQIPSHPQRLWLTWTKCTARKLRALARRLLPPHPCSWLCLMPALLYLDVSRGLGDLREGGREL